MEPGESSELGIYVEALAKAPTCFGQFGLKGEMALSIHWLLGVLLALPWWQMEEEARLRRWEELASHALQRRVLEVSAGFLGTPYAFSPLGEGEGVDGDPLFRWDVVDCLTFIEETMALSLAGTWEEVIPLLNDIRYMEGRVHYEARKHLMEAQWLPLNLKKGYLKSLAASLPGIHIRRAQKRLTLETWKHEEGKALGLSPGARPLGHFSIEMVGLEEALALFSKLPEGSLVVFIRADLPKRITRVRHLGLLVHGPEAPMLRHASRTFKKVVDEPIERFIRRQLSYASWTIEGVAIYELRKPSKAKAGKRMQKAPAAKSTEEP
ncbi:MAG: DUF1460 domain-containing protein [Proteobacteria bacterium]|nr:DUF1460 domain-containing protein [Cystobacterineae bacterium]MCL2259169.1 DUF1460 domain-containing protein [Cystobacterineae bacterium]MCL2314641.1 DUF1460 domain-containing protein [Pseudomonadota bacterium]